MAIATSLLLAGTPRGDPQHRWVPDHDGSDEGENEQSAAVEDEANAASGWLARIGDRADALLQACLDAEDALRRLDEEEVYVGVFSAYECGAGADEESLQRTAEGEFLRGRIQTGRVWSKGQLGTSITVDCTGPEHLVIYTTGGRNSVMGFGNSELVLARRGHYGSVRATTAKQDIRDSVRRVAEGLVTDLLERQKRAKAITQCD